MKEILYKQYADLLMSMCLDYEAGGINDETFVSNLDLISGELRLQEKNRQIQMWEENECITQWAKENEEA